MNLWSANLQEIASNIPLLGLKHCACLVTQSCLTLCDPMDYIAPLGSSVYGFFQGRILEWIAISSSRESSQPRDWTCVSCGSCIRSWILYHWACGEVLFVLSRTVSNSLCCSPVAHGTPSDLGARLPVLYLFAFSYCSWGSPGKNTGVGERLPFPPPGNLPNPRIELAFLVSPAMVSWFFTTDPEVRKLIQYKIMSKLSGQ